MFSKKGFTLVEILVVVVIITLAVVLAVPSLRSSQKAAKNQRAEGVLVDVAGAVRTYRMNNILNPNATDVSGRLLSSDFTTTSSCSGNSCLFNQGYLKKIPWDSEGLTYNSYKFFICPENNASSPSALKCLIQNGTTSGTPNMVPACKVPGVMVVMESGTSMGRFKNTTCAWVTSDGKYNNNYDYEDAL